VATAELLKLAGAIDHEKQIAASGDDDDDAGPTMMMKNGLTNTQT
jgi:hypothetical protein